MILTGSVKVGAVLSSLTVTETELDRPTLFVAEQVNVMPVVSVLKLEVVQPVEEAIPDSGSLTVQLTVTSPLYQPFDPATPLMLGVMTGAVASVTNVSLEQATTLPAQVGAD